MGQERTARAVVTPADHADVARLARLLLKLAPGHEIRVLTGGALPVFEVPADVADELAAQSGEGGAETDTGNDSGEDGDAAASSAEPKHKARGGGTRR